MPVRFRAAPRSSRLLTAAVVSAAAAAALWLRVLVEAWPRLALRGEICGAEPLALGHCAACLPALALTLVAAGLAVALFMDRRQGV